MPKNKKPLQGKYEGILQYYRAENNVSCRLGDATVAQISTATKVFDDINNMAQIEQLSQMRDQLAESTNKTRAIYRELESAADFLRHIQNDRNLLTSRNSVKAFIKHPMLMTRTVFNMINDKKQYQADMLACANDCKVQLQDLKSQINSSQTALQNVIISHEYQVAQQARAAEQLIQAEVNSLKKAINAFQAEEQSQEQFYDAGMLTVHPELQEMPVMANSPSCSGGFYESQSIENESLSDDDLNQLNELDGYFADYSDFSPSASIDDAAPMQLNSISMGQEIGLDDVNIELSKPSSFKPH